MSPAKGAKMTEEQRRNVSEGTKKAIAALPLEVREKIRSAPLKHQDYWSTHPIPPEMIENMRKAALADKGRSERFKGSNNPMTRPEVREKMRNSLIGRSLTEEHKAAISKGLKGRVFSAKHIATYFIGEANSNWKGGTSYGNYPPEFFIIRPYILKRDDYTCQLCFQEARTVHHIFCDFQRNKETELISVCTSCNGRLQGKQLYEDTLIYLQIKANKNLALQAARNIFG